MQGHTTDRYSWDLNPGSVDRGVHYTQAPRDPENSGILQNHVSLDEMGVYSSVLCY